MTKKQMINGYCSFSFCSPLRSVFLFFLQFIFYLQCLLFVGVAWWVVREKDHESLRKNNKINNNNNKMRKNKTLTITTISFLSVCYS